MVRAGEGGPSAEGLTREQPAPDPLPALGCPAKTWVMHPSPLGEQLKYTQNESSRGTQAVPPALIHSSIRPGAAAAGAWGQQSLGSLCCPKPPRRALSGEGQPSSVLLHHPELQTLSLAPQSSTPSPWSELSPTAASHPPTSSPLQGWQVTSPRKPSRLILLPG